MVNKEILVCSLRELTETRQTYKHHLYTIYNIQMQRYIFTQNNIKYFFILFKYEN